MKKNKPKTISFSKILKDLYKEDPSSKAIVENRAQELRMLYKLREIRLKSKLTQNELAKKSGIAQRIISRIESGHQNVTINTLIKLSAAMGKKFEINFR